ncbi:MAG: hypothetical protein Q8Q09_24985 [Deltaproteobacteria bacterium]|nr:hypothetical protein [Deltaproteobacteria bacterium]
MDDAPSSSAYRSSLDAAFARLESLEAQAQRETRSDSRDLQALRERLVVLENTARHWERARTSLALVLGMAALIVMQGSERFGAPLAVLLACVVMIAVGVALAWPTLSNAFAPRPSARATAETAHDGPTEVRVAPEPIAIRSAISQDEHAHRAHPASRTRA